MRILLIVTLSFLFLSTLKSQINNDNCDSAIEVENIIDTCYTIINGQELTLNAATAQGPFAYCNELQEYANNAWFVFRPRECFTKISARPINSNVDDLEIAMFLACTGGDLICEKDSLISPITASTENFLSVSSESNASVSFELCFHSITSPDNYNFANALMVSAPADGCTSVSSTTVGSCSYSNDTPGCRFNRRVSWFKTSLSENQSAFKIDLNSMEIEKDINLLFGFLSPEGFQEMASYCGPVDTTLIISGANETESYVFRISTTTSDAGRFNFCLSSVPADSCVVNNNCAESIPIVNLIPDQNEFCIQGCNILASSEASSNDCDINKSETVWYSIISDSIATHFEFSFTSSEIELMNVGLFEGQCSDLDLLSCVTIHNDGQPMLLEIPEIGNSYYIALSDPSSNRNGGNFEFCAKAVIQENTCSANNILIPISTSLGSPLYGPYLPDESVEFKFTIGNYLVGSQGSITNCQWLQGIVPVFGNGWDPSSFEISGEPVLVNRPERQYIANWSWWNDITYNRMSDLFTVGDFDNDSMLELCSKWESDCSNEGIQAYSLLPGGWFAHDPSQGANPNQTFGDGEGCDVILSGWELSFTLKTRSYSEAIVDTSLTDCSVKIYTFADGAIGAWNGPANLCGNDKPSIINSHLNNCQPTIANFIFDQSDNVVYFTNNSTRFDSCVWDFGDGTFSSEVNPIHIYNTGGSYQVKLICINDCSTDTIVSNTEIVITTTQKLISLNNVKIIPNPNAGNFLINIQGEPSNILNISLYSSNGNLIRGSINFPFFNGSLNELLNFDFLRNGIYFIRVQSLKHKPVFEKIVIQN